jgi:hypothetical protein
VTSRIVCPEFSTSMECFNEPRVYLKYMNTTAGATLFMALSGCADS